MQQRPTSILDFEAPAIQDLIRTRGWRDRPPYERIGAVYSFVKDEIVFGYNRSDDLAASEVLRDGYGQCNTKGTLLMALLRGVGITCRLRGFMIHKELQRGVVPDLIFPIAPQEILHSWVEVEFDDGHGVSQVDRIGDIPGQFSQPSTRGSVDRDRRSTSLDEAG